MPIRRMTENAKTAAEAYRLSRQVFESDPSTEAVCWPTDRGYVWIRTTPGQTGHLSGKEEPKPKLYDFSVQRAKSETPDTPPPDTAYTGVLKAWAEEYTRVTPRDK